MYVYILFKESIYSVTLKLTLINLKKKKNYLIYQNQITVTYTTSDFSYTVYSIVFFCLYETFLYVLE